MSDSNSNSIQNESDNRLLLEAYAEGAKSAIEKIVTNDLSELMCQANQGLLNPAGYNTMQDFFNH